ncbi:MAG: hypothetical protein OEZ57_10440 [Nitrospirota bacterium]|nr:hypothetical protein [Nitrospirota bacterium]MDH5775319.1 hypothetical protein [Nitrospirota bacterium]
MRPKKILSLLVLAGVFASSPEPGFGPDGWGSQLAFAQDHGAGHSGAHGGSGGHSGGKRGGHSGGGGESGHSSGGKGGQGGKGGGLRDIYIPGSHGSGSQMLEAEVFRSPGGHESEISSTEGEGRPDQKGRKGNSSSRGKPPWAGGAIPEDVELGRLNVARAPDHVLEKARVEVYATYDRDGNGVIDQPEDLREVDSPLANLALYKEALLEGKWSLDQAAMFLGKASDKNLPLSGESVEALNLILKIDDSQTFANFSYVRDTQYTSEEIQAIFEGANVAAAGATGFAQAADDVRAVVLYYHDHPS